MKQRFRQILCDKKYVFLLVSTGNLDRIVDFNTSIPKGKYFLVDGYVKMAGNRAKQKKLNIELAKNRKQSDKLQMGIANSLTGDSVYFADDLAQAIKTLKARITDAEQELSKLQEEEAKKKDGVDSIPPAYNEFRTWAEEFGAATMEQKKMIACKLFDRIEVDRD